MIQLTSRTHITPNATPARLTRHAGQAFQSALSGALVSTGTTTGTRTGLTTDAAGSTSASTAAVPQAVPTKETLSPLAALFAPTLPAATVAAGASPATPAFVPAFEQDGWVNNGNGTQSRLNPMLFATAETASAMAKMLGGTVKETYLTGQTASSIPERSIMIPGAKNAINAGVAATLYNAYGNAPGSQFWQIINRDAGAAATFTNIVS